MTNTIATPASTRSTRTAPRSITTARGLWAAVAACSAVVSVTSAVMVIGALVTGSAHTAAGAGLLETVVTVLLSAAISWFSFTTSKDLRRGDGHARSVLTIVAAGLLVASLFPAAPSVLGGITTGLAVIAALCSYLPSANRFLHPRRSNA